MQRKENLDFEPNSSHNKGTGEPDELSVRTKPEGNFIVSVGTWLARIVVIFGLVGVVLLPEDATAIDDGQGLQPDFVVILADDLGYADVGFHGCRDMSAPNLDTPAGEGIRCTQKYVSHPCRGPTRAGLMTPR